MSDVKTSAHFDPDGRSWTFNRVQDVEPILENNKDLRAQSQKSDWGRHIATVPNVIIEKWMNEDGVNLLKMSSYEFEKLIYKKLRDPDNAGFRTGKL